MQNYTRRSMLTDRLTTSRNVLLQIRSAVQHKSCTLSVFSFMIICIQYLQNQKFRGFRTLLQLGQKPVALLEFTRLGNLDCNTSGFAIGKWRIAPYYRHYHQFHIVLVLFYGIHVHLAFFLIIRH